MPRREDAKNDTIFKTSLFKEYCCFESKARRERERERERERKPSKNMEGWYNNMKGIHSYHRFLLEYSSIKCSSSEIIHFPFLRMIFKIKDAAAAAAAYLGDTMEKNHFRLRKSECL